MAGNESESADLSDVMGMTKAFILGTDGKTCWLYSKDSHNQRRLTAPPVPRWRTFTLALPTPLGLIGRTVVSAVAKERADLRRPDAIGRTLVLPGAKLDRPASQNEPSGVSASKLEWWIDVKRPCPYRLFDMALMVANPSVSLRTTQPVAAGAPLSRRLSRERK